MEKKFVPYPIALMLKELGYNEPCFAWFGVNEVLNHVGEIKFYMVGQPNDYEIYTTKTENFNCDPKDTDVDAPLWQQAIDWFREEHKLYINIVPKFTRDWEFSISNLNDSLLFGAESLYIKKELNYEEAREQAILKALEIIKRNNHGKII